MVPLIPVVVLLVRLLTHLGSNNAAGQTGPPWAAKTWRSWLWALLFLAWFVLIFVAFAASLSILNGDHIFTKGTADFVLRLIEVFAGACYLFAPWPLLRILARRGGHPKLVYYLAHLALIFPRTGETYSGAALLAALALAHRGNHTKEERDWVQKRLAKETRHLGTYATACALHQLLVARACRDEGRLRDADDVSQRARTILGTITYLSERGIPVGVRKVAYELLALDDARRGHWRSLELIPLKLLTPIARVLRGWGEHWLDVPPDSDVSRMKAERDMRRIHRIRRKVNSPIIDSLFFRPREVSVPRSAHAAWSRARRDFIRLLRGDRPLGPRALMNMLVGFDILFSPENPETVLPVAIRENEELVATIHDEVATAIADPLSRSGAPIHAMNLFGPISARVYQLAETSLFNEMEHALDDLDARLEIGDRLDPFHEWCSVSYLRSIYRRTEMQLGVDAVRQVWPRFVYRYCKLGVDLSESYPRMRPLAHAVFKCLSGESVRFNDRDNISQQAHNVSVTLGIE